MKEKETNKRYRFLWVALSLYLCLIASFKAYALSISDDGFGNVYIQEKQGTSIQLNGNTARQNFPVACCGGVTFSNESDANYKDRPPENEEEWN